MIKRQYYAWVPIVMLGLALAAGCSTVPSHYHVGQHLSPHAYSVKPLDAILHTHIRNGVVDYPAIARDPRFRVYIEDLAHFDPTSLQSRDEKLAFWINAYNAFAIQGILDGLSPLSWVGKYQYFVGKKYHVGGAEINLYGLEHKILDTMDAPRIHFAIVCASQSCPQLRSEAYTARTLDRQLDDQARRFINDPAKNRFDRQQKLAYLSKIFDWNREAFAAHADGSVLNYIAQYVNESALARQLRSGNYRIDYLDYDWHTNGPTLDHARSAR